VALPLLGELHVCPCPVCGGEGSRLDILDRIGRCYGGCGKVRLEQLFDAFFQPRPVAATVPAEQAATARKTRTKKACVTSTTTSSGKKGPRITAGRYGAPRAIKRKRTPTKGVD
jgi:hypothetical protein